MRLQRPRTNHQMCFETVPKNSFLTAWLASIRRFEYTQKKQTFIGVITMYYNLIKTEWGDFGYVVHENRLLATYLPDTKNKILQRIKNHCSGATEKKNLLPRFTKQVMDFFHGKKVRFTVDIDIKNKTPFQQIVLEQCRNIPFGKTASYADLARAAGNPGAARAVGTTMARNPLPLVIPCHRVVRSDGSLGGFSTPRGTKIKEDLINLEHQTLTHMNTHHRTLRIAG